MLSAHKLHKIGEYGHGKTVLMISSCDDFQEGMQSLILQNKESTPKLYLYCLDFNFLNDKENITLMRHSIANTLNKFHYADVIVMDYLSFILSLLSWQRISMFHSDLRKVIIFNPINFSASGLEAYSTLLGDKVSFKKINPILELINPHLNIEIKAKSIEIVGLDDVECMLKFGSIYNNTRIKKANDYSEAIAYIAKNFGNE